MQNYRNYICTLFFIVYVGFKKNKMFSLFSIVKMAANYAGIGRVGKFAAAFQQVRFVQLFWNCHNIVV